MYDRFIKIAATGLGSGLSPFAPGTVGTLVAVPVYMIFSRFSWSLYLLSVVALSLFAVYVSQEAEKLYNEKDPGRIVIDEIVGFQVTMFLVVPTVWHIFWGFIIFRVFDIVKPFPIRLCERKLPGGYGVVGDDIVAGIYGNILLLLLIRWVI